MEMVPDPEVVPYSEIPIATEAPNENGKFSRMSEIKSDAEELELRGPVDWESEADSFIRDMIDSNSTDEENQASDNDLYE
jgi:hypothetical protein